jgi:hypothetical protein
MEVGPVLRAKNQASLVAKSFLLMIQHTRQPQAVFALTRRDTNHGTKVLCSSSTVRVPLTDSCTPCFAHDPIKLPSHSDVTKRAAYIQCRGGHVCVGVLRGKSPPLVLQDSLSSRQPRRIIPQVLEIPAALGRSIASPPARSPKARSLQRFGDARPADGSRTAVERRFRLNDSNRNAALKSMGRESNA